MRACVRASARVCERIQLERNSFDIRVDDLKYM